MKHFLAALLLVPTLALAQYPNKPVRMIIPFAPGGASDFVGRIMQPKMVELLGQQLVVENKPGAAGNIGAEAAARSAPDGYTIFLGNVGSIAINPGVYPKLSIAPTKDFIAVNQVVDVPSALIVHPTLPVSSIREIVDYAKANPGKLSVGTSGVGGPQDVAARKFMQMTGTDMLNVAYKGGAPALADLLGGQIDLMFETSPTAVPYAKSGKLKALAVTSDKRLSTMADVPTVAEAGIAGYRAVGWMGLAAPAGTPPAIIARLNEQVQNLLNTSDVQKQIADLSLDVAGGSAASFVTFVRKESDDYAKFVKDSNITPQ